MTRIFIKGNKVNGKEKERLMILNTFSIFLSFITFPILNEMHFFLGIYMLVILFIYQVLIFLRKIEVNLNEKLLKIVLSILVIFSISNSTYNFVSWLKAVKSENYNIKPTSPFYGGFISDEELKSIGNVVKYMESKSNNVVVLSNKAAFYMILTNRNNGILDLPFRGNLGKEGEKGLVETIKKLNNTEILIEKSEEEMNWQESMMARQYIKNNKQKIGEIEEFEIYY